LDSCERGGRVHRREAWVRKWGGHVQEDASRVGHGDRSRAEGGAEIEVGVYTCGEYFI